MCGVGGIVLRQPSSSLPSRLAAMQAAMYHRGPDDQGHYVADDRRVGLVASRLAIRDLSAAGHMPMETGDGVRITFNGEIYNAGDLRLALERAGHVFRSTSDTEVVLRGYAEWGDEVARRLRGIFALAILDERPGKPRLLLLARDRLGVKPLYYGLTPEGVVFASELRAMLCSDMMSRDINQTSVVQYLLSGSVPGPATIYRDIQTVPAGSTLAIHLYNGTCVGQPIPYWDLPQDTLAGIRREDAVGHIGSMVADAVHSQMVSDVPVGAFLSGGLDSCVVATLMQRETSYPIRTCSMTFVERAYSESSDAHRVAESLGADHYERVIEPVDLLNELGAIFRSMDQPTVDGVNTYFVSQTARHAGLTVALSGLGGDELFGGYASTFSGVPKILMAARLAASVPGGRTVLGPALSIVPGSRWQRLRSVVEQPTPLNAYRACRGLFAPSEVRKLVRPWVWDQQAQEMAVDRELVPTRLDDVFSWVSRAELTHYTRNQLLRDTDVMSMAHSLEVRVPLLDHRLVDYVLRLPGTVKDDGVGSKSLLRDAVARAVPGFLPSDSPKRGFTFPFEPWLRGPLAQTAGTLLRETPCAEILDEKAVERVWERFQQGKLHWSRPWALMALAGWSLARKA